MEMKEAAESLEQSVQNADNKLDLIAWKIEQYENELKWVDSTEVSILKLLRSVNQVKEEYENLRREISEVQQLQKQLSDSLRLQLKLVQGKMGLLKHKIVIQNNITNSE
ncbi:hypothetical protein R5R35_007838 [Gryllus longicercus]|uniref:Ska2 N-terminal domain-containing protein n=1 Tax=Gryllus longicercus TaxID=2509291 RepID=A0AAN9W5A9_9ORTH